MSFASRESPSLGDGAAALPRPEYPRPQLVRSEWMNLNGSWDFRIGDPADDAVPVDFDRTIVVPFAPESPLSGVGETGFMERVWYRRRVAVPAAWAGRRIVLHVQACDHDATVWVDGAQVARHRGGYTPFSVDVTDAMRGSTFELVVRADDSATAVQARGKQSRRRENYEAFYARTTGLWQTVWLEPVASVHLLRPRITPRVDEGAFDLTLPVSRREHGVVAEATLADEDGVVARGCVDLASAATPALRLTIPADRVRLWRPGEGFLYSLKLTLTRGTTRLDEVHTYAGLRSVGIDGNRVLINGEPVFQRLVLDQGYYPDGHLTAPSDAALVRDIELATAAGFNGARLHQKVFEERFLFHADRLGYLVWGEFGDWGANLDELVGRQAPTISFVGEWLQAVERDYSHPSIIGWCPLNETYQPLADRITELDDLQEALYRATTLIDTTRPIIDSSGYAHRIQHADIYDSHLYEQNPERFAALMDGLVEGHPYVNAAADGTAWSLPYGGQPYFCSEFGGIWWSDDSAHGPGSWGYGAPPANPEQWIERFRALVEALLRNERMFGYCFTQLTDVFQEKNGIVDFDRHPKFPLERLAAIQRPPAAYEVLKPHPTQSKEIVLS